MLQIFSCPSACQVFIHRGTHLHKDIYWWQPGPSENFFLLQIPCTLLSYLSSNLQITVHLLSSPATVLCTVYAYNLYHLYCFYIVYTVLYTGCYRALSLCALPHSSADFVVTAIKRPQRYFRFILELKRLTPA